MITVTNHAALSVAHVFAIFVLLKAQVTSMRQRCVHGAYAIASFMWGDAFLCLLPQFALTALSGNRGVRHASCVPSSASNCLHWWPPPASSGILDQATSCCLRQDTVSFMQVSFSILTPIRPAPRFDLWPPHSAGCKQKGMFFSLGVCSRWSMLDERRHDNQFVFFKSLEDSRL